MTPSGGRRRARPSDGIGLRRPRAVSVGEVPVTPDPSAIPKSCDNAAPESASTSAAPRRRSNAPRSYTRHGLHALKVRVMVRGLAAIDQRTAAARALLDWRRELLEDLGGEVMASAAELALVEVATRTRLYLDHVDAVLMERESLVVRGRRLLPLVEQRQKLADGLARILGQLGLERRKPPAPSLETYFAAKYGHRDQAGSEPPAPGEAV